LSFFLYLNRRVSISIAIKITGAASLAQNKVSVSSKAIKSQTPTDIHSIIPTRLKIAESDILGRNPENCFIIATALAVTA
jgi:hypothetical protein